MTGKNYIPHGYDRIKVVNDLCAFVNEDFGPRANVVLYPRRLEGDFDTLAQKMADYFEFDAQELFIKYSEREKLEAFKAGLEDQALARCMDVVLADMEFLYHAGAKPHVRIVKTYHLDETTHDFHVDGLMRDFDRYMTCYNDPVTQFIRNSDVLAVEGHKVTYRPDAEVFGFRAGDFWKSRVRNAPRGRVVMFWRWVIGEAKNRAFVHRAQKSDTPRLMVVADERIGPMSGLTSQSRSS